MQRKEKSKCIERKRTEWRNILHFKHTMQIFSTVCCDPQSQRKCKKAKWSSEEALQIAEKRRDATGKGEKERYTHLNAEFQKIAIRDKKAFLSNQCKEIEGK